MKIKTIVLAAMASVLAVSAAVPSFADTDPAKKPKHINRMIRHADTNGDKRVSHAEMSQAVTRTFSALDTNRDGALSQSELANRKAVYKAHHQQVKASKGSGERIAGVMRMPHRVSKHFAKLDANHDGVLSKSEIAHVADRVFKRRDHNKDGYISAADFQA
jgi:Ca2+-binding EF-hand superfamily protein